MSFRNELKVVRNEINHYEKAIEGDKEIAIEFMGAKNKHRKETDYVTINRRKH